MTFLKNFDDGWKLYIEDETQDKNAGQVFNTHLKIGNNFLEGQDLSYLWIKPYSDNTHSLAYDYANQWLVDPKVIIERYESNYYSMNKDGSININLVLYYKYQSLFYYGIILWSTTFVVLISLMARDCILENKQRKSNAYNKRNNNI